MDPRGTHVELTQGLTPAPQPASRAERGIVGVASLNTGL